MRAAVAIVLVVLAIPTMGASCIPLWVLADRECGRARATGQALPRDAVLLCDVGLAGTVVFGASAGILLLYLQHVPDREDPPPPGASSMQVEEPR